MSPPYRVGVCVKEVKGDCAMGYKPGDCFTVERFYVSGVGKDICIHALSSMLTLLSPFLKGVSAEVLNIVSKIILVICSISRSWKTLTCRGTVIFELRKIGQKDNNAML